MTQGCTALYWTARIALAILLTKDSQMARNGEAEKRKWYCDGTDLFDMASECQQ